MRPALVVVAHEATRTGAPRVLLELIRALVPLISVPVAVRLEAEGPLAEELRSLAQVGTQEARAVALIVNGAHAAAAGRRFPDDVPAMLYVHEEGEALNLLPERDLTAIRSRYAIVACVSRRSREDLVALGVQPGRIRVVPPPVPSPAGHSGRPPSTLTAPGDQPLVLGCGTAEWRKGPDLFIDVARRVLEQRDVRFAWAGRRPRAFGRILDHDTVAAGLSARLDWLGELGDLSEVFGQAGLLLMTSREDPQPLVPLEAARAGVATVGFAIGGVADLAELGAAVTAPYPDTAALAEQAVALLDDPVRRHGLADRAAGLAAERTPERAACELLSELEAIAPGIAR